MKKFFDDAAVFLFSKGLKNFEIFILVTLLAWGYCTDILSVEFHPDETFWISSSVRFEKLLARDFTSPIWSEDPLTSYEVRPISSYFVSMGQRLGGIEADRLPVYWEWLLSTEENISRNAFPSAAVLWWSRLPMTIISVFGLLGIILLLAKAHSRMTAYIFALISFNDYFIFQLRRALSEPPLILFTVLALYASYKLLIAAQGDSIQKVVFWSGAAGIFSGLAGQSKLNGLACAGVAILCIPILMSDPTTSLQITKRRIPLIVPFVVLGTLLLVFIASYPFFYENTLDRVLTTFYIRGQVVQYQVHHYAYETIQPNDRLNILFQRIANYPINLDPADTRIAFFHWINFILMSFGISYCIKQVKRRRQDWEYFSVFLVGAFVCALPMMFTPLDWERYYLYPIFFTCIFFAIGIAELLFLWASHLQKQQAEKLNKWEQIVAHER